jgi:hypothetical protein
MPTQITIFDIKHKRNIDTLKKDLAHNGAKAHKP